MKRSVITLFAATALVVAGIGVTSAIAMPSHAAAPKLLRVVMRDPGCHWFAVVGKYTTSATVSSPIRLLNLDMAALDATSNGAVKRIPVGHSLLLAGRTVLPLDDDEGLARFARSVVLPMIRVGSWRQQHQSRNLVWVK